MTNTLGKSLAGDLKPPIFSLRRQFKARKEAAIFVFVSPVSRA